jgi:TRAP-type mannitol/chloroaromatic compound transport system substrate-binding protein
LKNGDFLLLTLREGGTEMKIKFLVRLGVILSVLVLALLIFTQPQGALAEKKYKLTFQATWPAGLTLFDNFKWLANRLDVMSNGRLQIKTLPAGAIVPAFELLDATSKGVVDGAHAWAGYWVGKDKAAILLTGGPGGTHGMDVIDYMGWIYNGGGLQLYRELYQDVLKMNVVAFPVCVAGPQALGWFKRPIKDLEDFKGMKCRQTGIAAEVYQKMGMSPVNMPAGEILPAGERGVIDCAEWIGGEEDYRLGLHNIWKYHYAPGMHEFTTVAELLINKDVWDRLPPDLQAMIEVACTEALMRHWTLWLRQSADALKKMVDEHGVTIIRTPDEILIAFLKAWDEVAAEESAKNPFFKRVLESQKAYASILIPLRRFYFPPYSFTADYYWPTK